MELKINKLLDSVWYCGMLMYAFEFEGGATGTTHSILYRHGMQYQVTVTVRGIGRRGFVLAGMPVDWVPKVGDVVKVHESQL